MIAAAILAAGRSSRLGHPKQLVSYRGRPLVRHVAEAALASSCDRVLVVVGHRGEDVERELAGLDLRVVPNPGWREGMSSSIRVAVAALGGDGDRGARVEALVLLTCDQPRITATVIDRLCAARRETGLPMAASAYAGTVGVPAVFDAALFPELLALGGAHGAKGLLLARPGDVARVPWPEGAEDVDTPEDRAGLAPPGDVKDR